MYGGIIYSSGENNIIIFNSIFEDLKSKKGAFLLLTLNLYSVVLLENNTVHINKSIFAGNLIHLHSIFQFSAKNLTFTAKHLSLIWSDQSQIYLKDVIVSDFFCSNQNEECLGYFDSSNVTIISSQFFNITALGSNPLIFSQKSLIIFWNSSFLKLRALNSTSVMVFEDSIVILQNLKFYNYSRGIIQSIRCAFEIRESLFSNENNSILHIQSQKDVFSTFHSVSSFLRVVNSTFYQNFNVLNEGGVI